ncbi:MAG: hypothetical protein M3022_15685 [Actinomycetota bacterium]|nr:hypothetical protein [Actinomycetota bacterium]
MDFFCLGPNGIRAAGRSASVLRHLRPRVRRGVRGRVVLALTTNPDYALLGVRRGNALGPLAGRLHTGSGFQLGRNRWYVLPAGAGRSQPGRAQGAPRRDRGDRDRQPVAHRRAGSAAAAGRPELIGATPAPRLRSYRVGSPNP